MQRIAPSIFIVCLCVIASACGEHPGGPCTDCLLPPQELEPGQQLPLTSDMACTGTPVPCGQYDDMLQCAAARGCQAHTAGCYAKSCQAHSDARSCAQNRCKWRFACGGQAATCYQASQTQCQRQAGCTWIEDAQVCSGVERSCSTFSEPVSCGAQTGCTVLGGCTDSMVAPSCLLNTNEANCLVNNACAWEPNSCSGTPAPCGANVNAAACKKVSGCSWRANR